jgi:hypothetical protein
MKLVYLLVSDCSEWEDIVIVLTEEEAIQLSITYPNSRVEIFSKHQHFNQYIPTYNCYKNGEFYTSSSMVGYLK